MPAIAVLGCGRIGRIHALHVARHPLAQLVAVFDVLDAAAARTASELGVRVARSAEEVFSDARVEAVIVATPTDTHVPMITAAVKAGKAVFCEKPVDLDLQRALACWREISRDAAQVMIGFNRRFDPSFRALRERLLAGEIGRLELAIITSRDPVAPPSEYLRTSGGLLRDMTIHDFDMARYLAGEIEQVHAFGANLVDPEIGKLGDIDTCCISLRARSGALLQINNSRRCTYGYDQRLEAFGSHGMLHAGNQYATSVESWGADRTSAREPVLPFFLERYRQAYEAELDAFITSLQERRPMSPDFADGVAALAVAVAAGESLEGGRAISVESGLEPREGGSGGDTGLR